MYRPDNFGFGLSERPDRFRYTPEAHAEALAEFVERLELRDITLVVHDFGGPIGPRVFLADGSERTLLPRADVTRLDGRALAARRGARRRAHDTPRLAARPAAGARGRLMT